MQVSVLDLAPVFPGTTPQQALQQSLILAQTAERSGYIRYWVAEHHDMVHVASASPEVLLAYIGAHTNSIRLGSGAVLLPYYKPIKVAEAFHMLAALFPGRIDLGIGRAPGGSAHVSMALSDSYLAQVRRMPELVRDLSLLLANRFAVEGEEVRARPLPPVAPQLWLLGTHVKSAQYAAEQGAGYVFGQFMSDDDGKEIVQSYRSQYKPSVLNQQPKAIIAVSVICAETEAEARSLAEHARSWGAAVSGGAVNGPQERQKTIVGTPQQVKEKLQQYEADMGVDEFMIVSMLPDYEKRLRSYKLLAEAVYDKKH
ncbi:LLM class flavin-dependent oxidoreductase [Brevibacillus fulvus]|uniref:Luciferase family oxidoreductase group 1 n=1 Tax=Brevibacillus fulvus TaxID=1125967 RepID=A0A938Y2G2_9BACL|nr:LLM class flavin-dependent oxidoreductase [Brevibacillus fulvus]MBM7590412.1 luciferase family oxidoreductase group 1 [Brevibacillus fulvus]